jgi:aryl-alcohol dehydrogenase-like predicted oxidoreductase
VVAPQIAEYPGDPGTSSVAHLQENVAAADLALPDDALQSLNQIAHGRNR